eukprot:TRINITY_DN7993_c0_g1_i3.p3 TRINITY_DN7993_c0_g1~~TRINITY_DN7993_c0_g1_i3.p3  ORF type:complete len:105 (-),score=8.58 TRINITY_DN7993_c0_g1_i3:941-1255(-)
MIDLMPVFAQSIDALREVNAKTAITSSKGMYLDAQYYLLLHDGHLGASGTYKHAFVCAIMIQFERDLTLKGMMLCLKDDRQATIGEKCIMDMDGVEFRGFPIPC